MLNEARGSSVLFLPVSPARQRPSDQPTVEDNYSLRSLRARLLRLLTYYNKSTPASYQQIIQIIPRASVLRNKSQSFLSLSFATCHHNKTRTRLLQSRTVKSLSSFLSVSSLQSGKRSDVNSTKCLLRFLLQSVSAPHFLLLSQIDAQWLVGRREAGA